MNKILTEENKELILKLLKKEEIAVLVIEDHKLMQQGLETSFATAFPNSTVYCFEGFGIDDDSLEDLIMKGRYDIVVTGGSLGAWKPHPIFGQSSAKIVEFVKEHSQKSFVMSTSFRSTTNLSAMKKGADLSVDKAYLNDFFNEVKELY